MSIKNRQSFIKTRVTMASQPTASSGCKRKHQPQVDTIPNTLLCIYGKDASIASLPDFVAKVAPGLKVDWNNNDERLLRTFVVPYMPKALQCMPKLSQPSITRSLTDLIDHTIWSLVRRRNKDWKQWNNVLAMGYKTSSDQNDHLHCPNLPPGVVSTNINDNVSYCKTSYLIAQLHKLVGEDILQVLLLYTSVLLPVHGSQSNYMLLCGPYPRRTPSTIQNHLQEQKQQQHKTTNTQTAKKLKPSLEPNACIPRFAMFYSDTYTPKVNLPSSHIFEQNDPIRLLKAIFPKQSRKCTSERVDVAKLILRNHKKCDYHRLLDRFCPLPKFVSSSSPRENKTNAKQTLDIAQLAAAFSPTEGVVHFMQAVLKCVFPESIWGSGRNLDVVLANLATFLKLRRHESFPNKLLMKGMRVTHIDWLWNNRQRRQQRADHTRANELLLFLLRWLFTRFIIPLLRSCFYITETEFSAQLVVFYRKPVWSIFRSLSLKKLLNESGQFKEITKQEALQKEREQQTGFSRLKLLPKTTGVRPVAMLSMRENVVDSQRQLKSSNAILSGVFKCLNYEYNRNPAGFGVGLFGLNQIYPVYRKLIQEIRTHKDQIGGITTKLPEKLFFVSVDIRRCYDNIHQGHLCQLIRDMLSEKEYLIQNHSVLHPFKSMDKIVRKPLRNVGPIGSYKQFSRVASTRSDKYNNCLFLDMGGTAIVQKKEIEDLLQEHLTSNLVSTTDRRGKLYLLQKKGIPQGSVLSTMLCNFYYGKVEKQMLSGTDVPTGGLEVTPTRKSALVRIVDDFLLVTTDQAVANQFVSCMKKGKPDLGVEINPDKTLASFTIDGSLPTTNTDGNTSARLPVFSGVSYFPWCGLLFDLRTGGVRLDYSRFANGKAENSITVDRFREGSRLDIRMKGFMRQRCQPILFDQNINSSDRVVANFFEAMMMCALKVEEYTRSGMELTKNIPFFLRCVYQVISYSRNIIIDRLKKQGGLKSIWHITERESNWLGFKAFGIVFQLKSNSAHNTLKSVHSSIKIHKRMCNIATKTANEFKIAVGLK